MLLCRAARWATLCRQAPKAAAVDAAQRVLWPAHAVPHRSTDMKAPRRCSVECAHGTGTCLRGRKGAPRARCGCTRGACWFFAKAVHSHGYAMASCMRNRTIALFTTRHLAEVPADLGRGIEGAQASTEQQPIVRLSSILGPCDTCIERYWDGRPASGPLYKAACALAQPCAHPPDSLTRDSIHTRLILICFCGQQ